MPHSRIRHALAQLKKLQSFWPVIGVLGLRQVGKTTLLRDFLGIRNYVSLDDEEILDEARASAKNFVTRLAPPVIIDEAQKVGPIFDAVKLLVDRKRKPGSYFLTGSSTFSAKIGIRESLTGRIGILHLHPFTLAETYQQTFEPKRIRFENPLEPRFGLEQIYRALPSGGLPVPLFARDPEQKELYFRNWLDTTVIRGVARAYGSGASTGRGYDPDLAYSILRQMARAMREGELPDLRTFKQDSRVLRRYLTAFQDVFLVRKIPCHEAGVGGDRWIFSDSGIARHLMGTEHGTDTTLSLARCFLFNEWIANHEYAGNPLRPTYFKSARGTPVDWVTESCAIKITTETKGGLSYEERSLAGAMKKLKLRRGFLVAPIEHSIHDRHGISVVPWGQWS